MMDPGHSTMRGSREAWTIEKPEEGKKEKERLREIGGDEISRFPMRPSCRAGQQGWSAINGSELEGGKSWRRRKLLV